MGAVYRAEHTMMRRDVAIKVLLPELGGKEEFARRFEREAESASRLAHPNIITVTDFGHTPEGSLFLVMEFLAGESLTRAISGGPMAPVRALNIVRQILRGLDMPRRRLVHRLKPNIMLVERDGRATSEIPTSASPRSPSRSGARRSAGVIAAQPVPSRRWARRSTRAPTSTPRASSCSKCCGAPRSSRRQQDHLHAPGHALPRLRRQPGRRGPARSSR
jgi:serine/threonine protein kinase